ncbi:MAG TPA: sugar transferase [Thermoanaerobaculia bacterium]|jgi:lipopolysaccharide/colanic/teichoic acid biosynthesis glycosyltransferase|nr:sugar transferase [Thermoanaerobaculia bacterium]
MSIVPLYVRAGKRVFDLSLALPTLLLTAPLLALLALAVALTLRPPILFRQRRPGLRGAPFTLYKLRTMREAQDAQGRPLPDADRLTSLGRFLRRTSLDELPELWNVVRGDMSLVGPRPLLPEYLERYSAEQARRHEVRPGLTGWAQVHGRNAMSWEEKLARDVWYVDHVSLMLDLRILATTLWKVATGEGISAPGAATAHPFEGSERLR